MELPELIAIVRELAAGTTTRRCALSGRAGHARGAQWRRIGEEYLARTRIYRKQGRPFFIDKIRIILRISAAASGLPKAKIIDARRHPLACCVSGFKQLSRWTAFQLRLEDIGRYYRDYVELMAHFDRVAPGGYCASSTNQSSMIGGPVRRMLDYCGLPFEAQCLRFFDNSRACAPQAQSRYADRSIATGSTSGATSARGSRRCRRGAGPVADSYPRASDPCLDCRQRANVLACVGESGSAAFLAAGTPAGCTAHRRARCGAGLTIEIAAKLGHRAR